MPQKLQIRLAKTCAIVSQMRLANERNGSNVTRFIYHINLIMPIHEINDNDMQQFTIVRAELS